MIFGKIMTVVLLLAIPAVAAEDKYALANFESVGMAIRGEHPELIGGGNFVLDDDGSIKPFTHEECETAALEKGSRNGLYVDRETSALGRMACFELGTAQKYVRDSEFWNVDLDKLFKDNVAKFPERLRPSEANNYSVFPLE